jgi:hypothetical protein
MHTQVEGSPLETSSPAEADEEADDKLFKRSKLHRSMDIEDERELFAALSLLSGKNPAPEDLGGLFFRALMLRVYLCVYTKTHALQLKPATTTCACVTHKHICTKPTYARIYRQISHSDEIFF